MKQTLLLMVLALGMCCINVSAQTTRECIVEDDGFEWYKTKSKQGNKNVFGAEDRYGNTILPCAFRLIEYEPYKEYSDISWGAGFKVWRIPRDNMSIPENDGNAYYLRNGKCIIPFSKTLSVERKHTTPLTGTYYECVKLANRENDFRKVICDANGKEIITFYGIDYRKISDLYFLQKKDIFYIQYTDYRLDNGYGHGLADGNGKIIVEAKSGQPTLRLSGDGRSFGYNDSSGKWISLASVSSMSTKSNPFTNNPKEDPEATLLIPESRPNNNSSSSNNNSSRPSSSSSSSSSNSGSHTTTVVVEQHGPVQVWVACGGCSLEPGRCTYCHGSGWGYNGRSCSRCGGNGKCTICGGTGGHYDVQYR